MLGLRSVICWRVSENIITIIKIKIFRINEVINDDFKILKTLFIFFSVGINILNPNPVKTANIFTDEI